MVRRKHIRTLVEQLLAEHRIRSAPVPIEKIAKALGVQVQKTPAADDLSGFLYRDRKSKMAVIGVNSSHHPNRRTFTTAHELGHFLLHDYDDIHVDGQMKIWMRNAASSQGTDIEEKEANLFAAEILMPKQLVERDSREVGAIDALDDGAIAKLAEKYCVSTQAMTIRLGYLGILEQ